VFDLLVRDETRANPFFAIFMDNTLEYSADWLLATVVDKGQVKLATLCTKPLNLLLYQVQDDPLDGTVEFLAEELKRIGFRPPGVLAEDKLARRFDKAYASPGGSFVRRTMALMHLDAPPSYQKAPGFARMLEESDMSFAPNWEQAFCEECNTNVFTLAENTQRIRSRLGTGSHLIWQDGVPVSQAVYGRETPDGAVINWVYTPQEFRNRGYATSVVAELSGRLLDQGKHFCCLFADANNPTSRAIYKKMGYYDICLFDDILFDN